MLSNEQKVYLIDKCPDCGSDLEFNGTDLYCPNESCPSKNKSRLYNWLYVNGYKDLKGCGESLIDKIVEYSGWEKIEDIYLLDIDWSKFNPGKASKDLTMKMVKNLFTIIDLKNIILGLSIEGLGSTNIDKLFELTNIKDSLKYNLELECKKDNLSIVKSLINNYNYLSYIVNLLKGKNLVNFSYKEKSTVPSDLIPVCVTGKLNCGTRSQFFEKYKDKIYEESIGKSKYLVTNTPDSGSSKNKQAQKLGVKVISEEEFDNLFR